MMTTIQRTVLARAVSKERDRIRAFYEGSREERDELRACLRLLRMAGAYKDGDLREKQPTESTKRAPDRCTKCKTSIAFTPDWTLYPWPDGAWLCAPCNDTRHESEDYTEVEAKVRRG